MQTNLDLSRNHLARTVEFYKAVQHARPERDLYTKAKLLLVAVQKVRRGPKVQFHHARSHAQRMAFEKEWETMLRHLSNSYVSNLDIEAAVAVAHRAWISPPPDPLDGVLCDPEAHKLLKRVRKALTQPKPSDLTDVTAWGPGRGTTARAALEGRNSVEGAETLVMRDPNGAPLAVAEVTRENGVMTIHSVAAKPHTGAGSRMMQELARDASKGGLGIEITAAPGTDPFFSGIGMKPGMNAGEYGWTPSEVAGFALTGGYLPPPGVPPSSGSPAARAGAQQLALNILAGVPEGQSATAADVKRALITDGEANRLAHGGLTQYLGLATKTGEAAGQISLAQLGLHKTFEFASPANMAQDPNAIRGSKVIQNMYGAHQDSLTKIIVDATDPRTPKSISQVKASIKEEWPKLQTYQVERIARTETAAVWMQTAANAYAANGISHFETIVASGPSIGVESEDPCDECVEAAADVHSMDDDLPPWHPNCRCDIIPVLEDEDGDPWLPPDEPWTGGGAESGDPVPGGEPSPMPPPPIPTPAVPEVEKPPAPEPVPEPAVEPEPEPEPERITDGEATTKLDEWYATQDARASADERDAAMNWHNDEGAFAVQDFLRGNPQKTAVSRGVIEEKPYTPDTVLRLRSQHEHPLTDVPLGRYEDFTVGGIINDLDTLIAKAEPTGEALDMTVFRGVNEKMFGPNGPTVGEVVHESGYTTTTTERDVAEAYAKRDPNATDNIVMEIAVPKGEGGVWYRAWGEDGRYDYGKPGYDHGPKDNYEFLMRRGAEFKVTGVEKVDGVTRVKVEMLPKTGDLAHVPRGSLPHYDNPEGFKIGDKVEYGDGLSGEVTYISRDGSLSVMPDGGVYEHYLKPMDARRPAPPEPPPPPPAPEPPPAVPETPVETPAGNPPLPPGTDIKTPDGFQALLAHYEGETVRLTFKMRSGTERSYTGGITRLTGKSGDRFYHDHRSYSPSGLQMLERVEIKVGSRYKPMDEFEKLTPEERAPKAPKRQRTASGKVEAPAPEGGYTFPDNAPSGKIGEVPETPVFENIAQAQAYAEKYIAREVYFGKTPNLKGIQMALDGMSKVLRPFGIKLDRLQVEKPKGKSLAFFGQGSRSMTIDGRKTYFTGDVIQVQSGQMVPKTAEAGSVNQQRIFDSNNMYHIQDNARMMDRVSESGAPTDQYEERHKVLQATKRWFMQSADPANSTSILMAHEAGHALDYAFETAGFEGKRGGLRHLFGQRLEANGMTRAEKFSVSEYAGVGGGNDPTHLGELWAEVTAARVSGMWDLVPTSIQKAYDETLASVDAERIKALEKRQEERDAAKLAYQARKAIRARVGLQ